MSDWVSTLLLIVNVIFFLASIIFGILAMYEEIMGPAKMEKLLKKLNFPLNYNQTFVAGIVCIALTFAIYILRAKLSGTL